MSPVTDPLGPVVVATDDLQDRIAALGKEITADYADRPPLLVGVLKGAFMFMSDLSRAIDLPVEFDFMAVSSYGSATSKPYPITNAGGIVKPTYFSSVSVLCRPWRSSSAHTSRLAGLRASRFLRR